MILETSFKGCAAVQLENDELKVIVLPRLGGKIASIYRKDEQFELLFQNKEDKYRKPKLYDSFELYDASGFDDAFPTINKCTVKLGKSHVEYPDHGEIWTADFTYRIENDKLIMTYESSILKYTYEKAISLSDSSLQVEYNITNCSKDPIPCIWAMHCLIRCEEDMRLIFPEGTSEIENVYESEYLGKVGQMHSYPLTEDRNGEAYYLDRVGPPDSKRAEKYYVRGEVKEGFCGVIYPSKNLIYSVTYDKEKLPYLGFWVTEGGFRGDYNCALEPANGYYDSIDIAEREKGLFTLEAGKELSFYLKLELKRIEA